MLYLEVDQLGQGHGGVLDEGLVQVAAHGALGLLEVSQPGADLLLLLAGGLAGLQQDLDGGALLSQHQTVPQLLPLRLLKQCC